MSSGAPTPVSSAPGDIFATTHWTVVLAAGQRHTPQSDHALEQLCRTYWFPLYAYVRRRGYEKADAEDLVQAFFARFLAKNYLAGLSEERGRFRAFLLAALKNFLINEWKHAQRQKRGGGEHVAFARLGDGGHEISGGGHQRAESGSRV
jgi:DNA-directed RNA polymerase specialized sigma24 family protein